MLIPASLGIFTLTLQVCQYINFLIDKYSLRVLPRKKSIIDLDNLYLLLYTHWVFDDSTFKNERQWIQVATSLLTIAISIVDRVSCLTFESNLTIPIIWTYSSTISWSLVLSKLERLWTMSKRMKWTTWRAIVMMILEYLSMLLAKTIAISTNFGLVIAIAIQVRFMNIVRIATSTTIAI